VNQIRVEAAEREAEEEIDPELLNKRKTGVDKEDIHVNDDLILSILAGNVDCASPD
jgi:hypothetical protein